MVSPPTLSSAALTSGLTCAPDIIDVGRLANVKIVDNAIDRLVMRPETNKETIKAIVKTYTDNRQDAHFHADYIRGKGEGQIFLLHGPPGTGKTLTAGMAAIKKLRKILMLLQNPSQSILEDHCSASLRQI